jgi:1-acyl-sn-glycerol-3-phosphate acyltransferase
MSKMLRSPLLRRLLTVPTTYLLLVVLTVLLPILLPLAALIDLGRWLANRAPAMALRMLTFGWLYLVGEGWAIIALAILGVLPDTTSTRLTYAAQRAWLDWNFDALRLAFSLDFTVEGGDEVAPGPILLLSRHASMIDTMLPGRYVVRPHRIKLRYVLKKELLVDPALDIGGNRLPNYFIDRAGNAATEIAALRDLARSIDVDEGVLIYPEGTRYTEQKRVEYTERWRKGGGALAEIASSYRRVLPPRPGGTLALLDASTADVVVLAHRGLEGFARVSDIWNGGLVGSQVELCFWRVTRPQIPHGDPERTEWLFRLWAEVDAWVVGEEGPAGGGPG